MKLNKLTLLAALGLGLLALSPEAKAQDMTSTNAPAATAPMTPRRGRPVTLEQLTKLLALTDEQKTNVDVVLQDQKKKLAELRQDTSLSTEDRRAKSKELRDATTAKMKEILTPEQFAKYQAQNTPGRRPLPSAKPTTGN